jgi:23S rRNA (uracil1939-C5)-methyltransferase
VFTKWGVPGDIVDIRVKKKRKTYIEGEIINIHKYSPKRVRPKCSHFKLCGGCSWQNMDYKQQLLYKQNEVFENLSRIGKIKVEKSLPIIKSDKTYFYRNKMEFSFSNSRWITKDEIKLNKKIKDKNALGFHKYGMWSKVIDIEKCYLQSNISNKIRRFIKEESLKLNLNFFDLIKQEGDIRSLMIKITLTKEIMIVIQFFKFSNNANKLLETIRDKFKEIKSLMYVVNNKKNDTIYDLDLINFSGNNYITEKINNLYFRITAKSFFQTNSYQTEKLYNVVKKLSNLTGNEIVYDLYCGTGSIGLHIAKYVKMVYGIEVVMSAVIDAIENAKNNKINNIHFFHGDLINVFSSSEELKLIPKPDIIILDPPRAGIHENTLNEILKFNSKKIIYVSCNPSTQARDIKLLSEHNYKIKNIQPVDMFPHTPHIENIVLMEKYE